MCHDFLVVGYFIYHLSNRWELWAPFEEALHHLPSKGYLQNDWEKCKVIMFYGRNILSSVYGITIVLPYQYVLPPASLLNNLSVDKV